jgi:hypothetical protein
MVDFMEDAFLDGRFLGAGVPSADDAEQSAAIDIAYAVKHSFLAVPCLATPYRA